VIGETVRLLDGAAAGLDAFLTRPGSMTPGRRDARAGKIRAVGPEHPGTSLSEGPAGDLALVAWAVA